MYFVSLCCCCFYKEGSTCGTPAMWRVDGAGVEVGVVRALRYTHQLGDFVKSVSIICLVFRFLLLEFSVVVLVGGGGWGDGWCMCCGALKENGFCTSRCTLFCIKTGFQAVQLWWISAGSVHLFQLLTLFSGVNSLTWFNCTHWTFAVSSVHICCVNVLIWYNSKQNLNW